MCEKNGVVFIALPPNSTHLLQPLDIAYFRPMKIAWKNIITDWKMKGKGRKAPSLPKDEFPKLLKIVIEKLDTTGKQNLVSADCPVSERVAFFHLINDRYLQDCLIS